MEEELIAPFETVALKCRKECHRTGDSQQLQLAGRFTQGLGSLFNTCYWSST